jgi:quercetin dioxygenase-like cupin family protein
MKNKGVRMVAETKRKTKKTTSPHKRKERAMPAIVSLQHTAPVRPRRASELRHLVWQEVELEIVNPLLERQLIVGKDVMLARILLRKGCIVPLHSHVNEQLSYVLEGSMKFWIDGKEIVLGPGEVLTIPPNMPHRAEALEDTIDLDIFHPPRIDWLNGTDRYLRVK